MSYDLSEKLVVAISSRALFNMEKENEIFEKHGLSEYTKYQFEHENEDLEKGSAFPLIKTLLSLNEKFDVPIVEIIIISRNSPETGLRVFNCIENNNLNIVRAAFTGGSDITKYLSAFKVDLFLSKNEDDVQNAINSGFSAALVYDAPIEYTPDETQIRIAFDADAVVFSDESEKIYQENALPLFLTMKKIKEKNNDLIRIAIVTARNSPAHKRVIHTLRHWGVKVDEALFLTTKTLIYFQQAKLFHQVEFLIYQKIDL